MSHTCDTIRESVCSGGDTQTAIPPPRRFVAGGGRALPSARATLAVALSLLLLGPVAAVSDSFHERRVDRVVATPTPAGPIVLASDEVRWRVDVPAHATALVRAEGAAASWFHATFHLEGRSPPDARFPARAHAFELPGPAAWIVRVDPAAGADFHARVTFQGFVSQVGGAPAAIGVEDAGNDRGCVTPGVCLP